MNHKFIIYWSTLAMFSTIDEGEQGRGCMFENGDPNWVEFNGQINQVKPLGVRGTRSIPTWSKSRRDRNCTPFQFVESADKFSVRMYNEKYGWAEEQFIKAWCGSDKEDEYQSDLFDACLGKPKHQAWNPWFRNIEGIKGWYAMDAGTTALRRRYIDYRLSYKIPLIQQGYKLTLGMENEPPVAGIPALIDSLEYVFDRLVDVGLDPYRIIVPGVQRVPEVEQTRNRPYRPYKNWRKKRPDEMKLEALTDTVHKYPTGTYGAMILEAPENVPAHPGIIMSLDGIYVKRGGVEVYPDADDTYGYFYPLFYKIKHTGRKYNKIIKNNWKAESLGWGTNFGGSNVVGIAKAWEDVFGYSLARPDFKPLPVPVEPKPDPEPEPPKPDPVIPEPITPGPVEPVPGPVTEEVTMKNLFDVKGFLESVWKPKHHKPWALLTAGIVGTAEFCAIYGLIALLRKIGILG